MVHRVRVLLTQARVLCASPQLMTECVLPCSLHSVHDEEKPFELEVSWICDATDRVFQRVPEDILQAAEAAAKAALEDSDMYDDSVPFHSTVSFYMPCSEFVSRTTSCSMPVTLWACQSHLVLAAAQYFALDDAGRTDDTRILGTTLKDYELSP